MLVRDGFVRASGRLYALLLRIRYPGGLRTRYGDEMRNVFERCLREGSEERGFRGVLSAWWVALRDLLRPLPPEIAVERSGAARAGRRGWIEDLSFAWRSLRREPRFTASVALVLGLAVALNLAVFAVVNAYLIRPLPYPEADRLVSVAEARGVSYRDVDEVFEKAGSWDLDAFTLIGDGEPELVRGAWVTPDFLDLYGVRPALGRRFDRSDAVEGAVATALISHGLWTSRYGGDPGVLGRTFEAYTSDRPEDAESFEIVGVLPADFWHFNQYTGILASLRADYHLYSGRLREGVPLERAETYIDELARATGEGLPPGVSVTLTRTQDAYTERVRPTLWMLQAAVLLVLAVACANVAVLLLVRSLKRAPEIAVRRAMGAGLGRLSRQLLFEGLLLAAAAATVGVVAGELALRSLRSLSDTPLGVGVPGGMDAVTLDGTVLGALVGLSVLTGVLCGLVPLVGLARRELGTGLLHESRGSTDTRGRRRLRAGMISAEIALSLALLTGAGLMVRSALNLQRADLGFNPTGVTRAQVGLRQSRYTEEGRVAFFRTLRERVAALPEVRSVGFVSAAPFTWRFNSRRLESDGGGTGEAITHYADAPYFRTLGIPVLEGRVFQPSDGAGEPVALVSRRVAEHLWPGGGAVGRRVRLRDDELSEPGPWLTVVGVVGDVEKAVGLPDPGDLYVPVAQRAPLWVNVMMRHTGDRASVLRGVRSILAELDPDVPLSAVTDLEAAVRDARAPSRLMATLLTTFALFAAGLAVVGLYGVMAYAVRQRRRDAAIRVALGAAGRDVRNWFLRSAAAVLGVGVVLGLVGGRIVGRGLEGQLHGVSPGDPLTLGLVTGMLVAAGWVAVWIPARRASAVNPASALREE